MTSCVEVKNSIRSDEKFSWDETEKSRLSKQKRISAIKFSHSRNFRRQMTKSGDKLDCKTSFCTLQSIKYIHIYNSNCDFLNLNLLICLQWMDFLNGMKWGWKILIPFDDHSLWTFTRVNREKVRLETKAVDGEIVLDKQRCIKKSRSDGHFIKGNSAGIQKTNWKIFADST